MTAPSSPYTFSPGPAQPFEVRIGAPDDSAATEAEVDEYSQVLSITRSAGGHRLDHCVLRYDLAAAGKHLEDFETPTNASVKVQIHAIDPDGADPFGCVFSGEMGLSAIKIDRGESQVLSARIEPWHFGDPLLGPHVLDVDGSTILTPHTDIVFQPEIDRRIEDNMLVVTGSPTASYDDYSLWVDPEALRTTAAETAKSQGRAPWTLSEAVHSLCWACNPAENFIANPTLDELQAVFEPDDAVQAAETLDDSQEAEEDDTALVQPVPTKGQSPNLRNIRLPRGKRLPALLDELLPRFGYDWFVEPVLEETDASGDPLDPPIVTNHIRVFQLGAGAEVELYLQPIGNPPFPLFVSGSNVPDLDVEWNWADVANQVIGQGSFEEWEATFELYRGWPQSDDAFTADQLSKVDDGEDDSDTESVFKQHPDAWRKWVLNEAGDYCGTRLTVSPIPAVPFALKALLGANSQAKRRKFHHCLTKALDGERRDVHLEYRDPTVGSDSAPGAWKTIPREGAGAWSMAGFHVLEKECGIYFSGATPPPDLMEFDSTTPGAARLRITAAIRGDDRLQYEAVRETISPNANTIKLFVDLSDRFHYRQILAADLIGSGSYPTVFKSALLAETYGDDTVDDTQLLIDYCDALRTLEQAARLSCEFEVAGIQTAYQIGQLVTAINGRNISFNRNSPDQAEKLYPQITAITFDRQRQRTRLRVETFDFTPGKLKKLSL